MRKRRGKVPKAERARRIPPEGDRRRCKCGATEKPWCIRECEEHGWATDRADPHAREHAFDIARQDPPSGVSPDDAVAEVRQVLDSIGDTCPECLPAMQAPQIEHGPRED
jgi:hypothetical protein